VPRGLPRPQLALSSTWSVLSGQGRAGNRHVVFTVKHAGHGRFAPLTNPLATPTGSCWPLGLATHRPALLFWDGSRRGTNPDRVNRQGRAPAAKIGGAGHGKRPPWPPCCCWPPWIALMLPGRPGGGGDRLFIRTDRSWRVPAIRRVRAAEISTGRCGLLGVVFLAPLKASWCAVSCHCGRWWQQEVNPPVYAISERQARHRMYSVLSRRAIPTMRAGRGLLLSAPEGRLFFLAMPTAFFSRMRAEVNQHTAHGGGARGKCRESTIE